jgi:catechol 2,3-dioxygenase-like lactoylglutathione lyase family enzyme
MIGAEDIQASKRFYDATLGALGVSSGKADHKGRVFWTTKQGVFAITRPNDGQPAFCGKGSTVGFAATSPEEANAWHKAGTDNGGEH